MNNRFVLGAIIGTAGAFLYNRWRKRPSPPSPTDLSIPVPRGVRAVRPRPSGELLVQVDAPESVVLAFASNQDAATWIQDEASQFGTLYLPEDEHSPYILIVSPFYNPLSVGHFLFVGYHEGVDDSDHSLTF